MRNIVILGGGYGGLTVASELLSDRLPDDCRLTLIDRMPFQGLKTEYYALAAGTVSDIDLRVAFPVDPRLLLRYGEVLSVDLEAKRVLMEAADPVEYDLLVIALGCVDKYHGIPGAPEFSCSIQTFSSSRRTYQQVNDVKPYGQVTIVGGGLSGVEVASELRESRPDLNIRILDRGPSVLSAFPGKAQEYVRSWFLEHDVEMRGHVALSRLEQGVLYDRDDVIETDVTVWTAGIQSSPIVQAINGEKDSMGRLLLTEHYCLPSDDSVYVVGDCASLPFAPSGQAAEAQGKQVAEVIRARLRGETVRLKQIKLKGVLGSLGKKAGFGVMGRTTLMGRVPRLLKSGVLWMSKSHLG
ncbi:NAD(P)/FAD-dependent oxidoreductase [Paenibacillus sp.]|uniref:NAD(P)/FAD-dependent oxidoreductase n=1 Tax=Paenibacillus sp. TaxID=58172 RepID=UPI002D6DDE85|nr:NAD(P)/FAD-dependent oxidoreductase [Paenibacillus sp.]HZG57569.1 NAD(P)/FAD-dependent oxidoreductase [Paenibacillus sp.]